VSLKKLTRNDYPIPRVVLVKGKYSVEVSIPRQIRHLFGSGKGGTTNIRKATGTNDRALADKMLMTLGEELYAKLDQKQLEAEQDAISGVDDFARKAITDVAQAFRYNRGDIPPLEPSTDYAVLEKMKARLDMHRDMSDESIPQPNEEPNYQDEDDFTDGKEYYLETYRADIVESYWQDLLTQAAMEQGLSQPSFADVDGIQYVNLDGDLVSHFDATKVVRVVDGKLREYAPVERKRQVLPPQSKTVSSVMDEYLERVRRDYDVVDTQKKLKRWAQQFLEVMGNLEIAEIRPTHAYEYIDKILELHPTRSNTTLKDYCWGVQVMLKYCVERDYIQTNPFRDIDLSKRGEVSEKWEPYERSELKRIFAYDWSGQDRLLLSLYATTGMRPSEAGNLTWERFNDTEHEGIRYFSTKDTATERVRIKNRGSARLIPLHPDLKLPPKATGRLFDYDKDQDGRCGTDIGHKLNHVLEGLVSHPFKSVRSFRKTFKKMMRGVGVEEEVHDFITGHRQGISAFRKNYGGMDIEVMFEAVSKLDISFLVDE